MGRPSSIVEVPDTRYIPNHQNSLYTPEFDSSPDYRCHLDCHSPSYQSYDDDNREIDGGRRRSSSSPDYSRSHRRRTRRRNPSLSYRETLDHSLPKTFGKGWSLLDRNSRGFDEEFDEELKGLSFEERRRLKRLKMRKFMRYCIWSVTPSTLRGNNEEEFEAKAYEIQEKYEEYDEKNEDSSGKDKEKGNNVMEKERKGEENRERENFGGWAGF